MAPIRDRRPGFSRRAQYGVFIGYVVAVAGALVAAVLLAIATFDPPTLAILRIATAEVTTPVSSVLSGIGRGIVGVPSAIGDYFLVMQRNAAMRKQIAQDRAMTMRARGIIHENRRLKALLAVREGTELPVVTARLVSSTASSTRRFRGPERGLSPGRQ